MSVSAVRQERQQPTGGRPHRMTAAGSQEPAPGPAEDAPEAPPSAPAPEPGYRAYIMRCWREAAGWRFSLEAPHSGTRRGFLILAALVGAVRSDLSDGAAPRRQRPPRRGRGRAAAEPEP
jgi:hypothetical protein